MKCNAVQFTFAVLLNFSFFAIVISDGLECYSTKVSLMGKATTKEDCTITHNLKGCKDCIHKSEKYFYEVVSLTKSVTFLEKYVILNAKFDVAFKGPYALVVNGVTDKENDAYCSLVCIDQLSAPESINSISIENMEIPHGIYTINVLQFSPTNDTLTNGSLESCCVTVPGWKNMVDETLVLLPKPKFISQLNTSKDSQSASPFVGPVEDGCFCMHDCIQSSHVYEEISGQLFFHYNLTNSAKQCKNLTVSLLKSINPDVANQNTCLNLSTDILNPDVIFTILEAPIYASKSPVIWDRVPTGCYVILTFIGHFYGYFWINSSRSPNTYGWNTIIQLTKRSFERSIEVRWRTPAYPNNFTRWDVQLWYSNKKELDCTGINSVKIVEKAFYPEQEIVNETFFRFTNLSEGFYCSRLFPFDEKCNFLNCHPLSSQTVYLKAPQTSTPVKEEETNVLLAYILPLVGVAVGLLGIILIFTLFRSKIKIRSTNITVQVSMEKCQLETINVLVIWSKNSPFSNPNLQRVVDEFKDLLKTYSKCKVYDYLDLFSLSWRERQSLLHNPVQWLYSFLNNANVKVIFIASNTHSKAATNTSNPSDESNFGSSNNNPSDLDNSLYSHALRYLRDPMKLSSEYGRIFFVRFPGLNLAENELENEIVPWMRFNIPYHLRNLTLKLRGLSDEMAVTIPDLSQEILKSFEDVVNSSRMN